MNKYTFSFNDAESIQISMERAIEIARNRAIRGESVELKCNGYLLGKYSPSPLSPMVIKNSYTREIIERVYFCDVDIKLPRKRY